VIKESPPFEKVPGAEKTIEDTVRVTHTVTVANSWKAEAELKARVYAGFGDLKARIKVEMEEKTGHTYGVETVRKRSVILKGDGSYGRIKVVWVKYYRTGTAKIKVDGMVIDVPIEFEEDFDLIPENAEK
jgi:hypothetical protein